jgi:DNA-binding transcriptional regulator PaaX
MNRRKFVWGGALGLGLLADGIAIAQNPPDENVDPKRHPHLAAAQHHIRMAYDEIVAAQQANKYDMQGHGDRSLELLDQASHEVKAAAEAANQNR